MERRPEVLDGEADATGAALRHALRKVVKGHHDASDGEAQAGAGGQQPAVAGRQSREAAGGQ